jgi:hypothetical protein
LKPRQVVIFAELGDRLPEERGGIEGGELVLDGGQVVWSIEPKAWTMSAILVVPSVRSIILEEATMSAILVALSAISVISSGFTSRILEGIRDSFRVSAAG